MMGKKMNKKGDASIVATVFLIISAIAIAVMVTTFSKQTEEKVSEQIVSMGSSVECEDIRLSVDGYENNQLKLTNRGTLSVKSVNVRIYDQDQNIGVVSLSKSFSDCTCVSANCLKDGSLLPQKQCYFSFSSYTPYKIEIIPRIINEQDEDMGCENRISKWEE